MDSGKSGTAWAKRLALLTGIVQRVNGFRGVQVSRLEEGRCLPHGEWVRHTSRPVREVGRRHALPNGEMVLCLKGAARLVLCGNNSTAPSFDYIELVPGRAIVIPSGAAHCETFERPALPFALVWLVFPPGVVLINRASYGANRKLAHESVTLDSPESRVVVRSFLRELDGELSLRPLFTEMRLRALLLDLLVQLSRSAKSISNEPPNSAPAQRWHRLLTREAIRFLEANCTRPVSLGEVAARLHLSPNYLSTIFHRECGKTLREYTIALRVERARKMLAETSEPIKAIAELAGFSDEYYFSRVFKRVVGMPPGAFRRSEESPKAGGRESIVPRARQ